MGDFNFDNSWIDSVDREQKVIKEFECSDAWEVLYPKDEGYTVDNVNRSPKRIDRFVYFSGSSLNFVPTSMEILGKIENSKNDMKISDHYGLLIKTSLKLKNF